MAGRSRRERRYHQTTVDNLQPYVELVIQELLLVPLDATAVIVERFLKCQKRQKRRGHVRFHLLLICIFYKELSNTKTHQFYVNYLGIEPAFIEMILYEIIDIEIQDLFNQINTTN